MGVHEGGHASKQIKGIGGRGGGRLLFLVRREGGHGVRAGRVYVENFCLEFCGLVARDDLSGGQTRVFRLT